MRSRFGIRAACFLLGVLGASQAPAQTDVVRIRLAVTDASGATLASVPVGASFEVRGYVQDIRTSGALGVFGAWLDVLYDQNLATFQGPISFSPDYTAGRSGDGLTTPGLIDEVGAFRASSTPPGPNELLLFTAPFQAAAPGAVIFMADPADDSPDHDVLIYGQNEPVCPSSSFCIGTTALVNASVTITGCSAANGQSKILENDSVLTSETFEVCDWIRVGPNYWVYGPAGALLLRVGNRVEFWNDFTVGVDGTLTVVIDPALVP